MSDDPTVPAACSDGLASAEAARRLTEVGPNDPSPTQRTSTIGQVLQLFASPLVLILLAASGISAALGEAADATIIALIVLVGIQINFWQTRRSQRAADRLRASVAPTATACRDGRWREIPIQEVVPGDRVRLSAGDLVPADAVLVESKDLTVDQAVLTGESLPVDKHAGTPGDDAEGPNDPVRVFMGTSIVSGTATARVAATGRATRFGGIAQRLGARAPESEFDRGLRRFSWLILRTTIVLVFLILATALALRRDPLESLLFAVALGVGLTPEFLPMIASVTLTAGALRMARDGVIVKRLPAMQNFGSMDVLCSDKTGTLTTGIVSLASARDATGAPSQTPLHLGAVNSRFETGIRSPLDVAILRATDVDVSGYQKVDEIPFDFQRRRLSVVVDTPDGRRLLVTKGAAEAILPLCEHVEINGVPQALDPERLRQSAKIVDDLGIDGFRVLAVAYREVDRRPAYQRSDEASLTLAGVLAFADPVRPDAREAVAQLRRDGVTIKIISGDGERVARHVARQVGITSDRIVTGEELSRLGDTALGHLAEQVDIFARVSPSQKNQILLALKRRGHVVGFIGDGINDAPSIHTADIGISVMTAADVAREAADVILGKTGLPTLHRGILQGRQASGNLMKYLLMGTSSNFGNMFSMAVASVFLPFLPMLPTQILLNNFLYDLAQITIPTDRVDPEYTARPQRWDMRLIRDFMLLVGPVSSAFDFLTFYVLLHVLHASETLFHTGWFVESLATQTLVLFVIRTMGNPLRSRPSAALTVTTVAIVLIGLALPATPLASPLGFTQPPWAYFAFLVAATALYLCLVELVKRRVVARAVRATPQAP